jgi:hypothetical protein
MPTDTKALIAEAHQITSGWSFLVDEETPRSLVEMVRRLADALEAATRDNERLDAYERLVHRLVRSGVNSRSSPSSPRPCEAEIKLALIEARVQFLIGDPLSTAVSLVEQRDKARERAEAAEAALLARAREEAVKQRAEEPPKTAAEPEAAEDGRAS